MKFLVTGGAGFIGSHLIMRLLDEGHEIVCLDDLNDFYDPEFKKENLASFLENPAFHLIEGDIRDKALIETIFESHPFDQVVHLAARAGVRPSLKEPQLYVDVNITGTLNLLEAMRNHGVKKMVFASSSSVYGKNTKVPFQEDDPLNAPYSPYAATKTAGEVICRTYFHLYGLSSICLRFFTVYGPKQRPEMAIYKFTKALYAGDQITLFGEGDSQRDYTFVSDIIEGICGAIHSTSGFEVYNLGDSKPIALKQLLQNLEKITGKTANVTYLEDQAGDVPVTYANIDKAKKELNYMPKVPIEEGLQTFVDWFQQSRLAVQP